MCGLGMEGIGAGNGKRRRIWVGVLVMKVEVDERKKMMMKGVQEIEIGLQEALKPNKEEEDEVEN